MADYVKKIFKHTNKHSIIYYCPQEIIDECNVMPVVKNGYVYAKPIKSMYVLPQAGMLTNKLL